MVSSATSLLERITRQSPRLVSRRALTRGTKVQQARKAVRQNFLVDSLEDRTMFSLLGVSPGYPAAFALSQASTAVQYSTLTPTSGTFDTVGTPQVMYFGTANDPVTVTGNANFQLHIKLDATGQVLGGNVNGGDDLQVTGTVDVHGDGSLIYSGTLLQGKIAQFGYQASGTTAAFDFRFTATGGQLMSYFANSDIGVTVSSENSTFTGGFTSNFTGAAKTFVGAIPPPVGQPKTFSICGNKFLDTTGNGLSADDKGLAGVTIELYADKNNNGTLDAGDGVAVATTVTAATTGAYSFTNLAAGRYFVKEVVPAGYVRTGPTNSDYYTVVGTAGVNQTGLNFDNYKTDCMCAAPCNISYVINGKCAVSDLTGHVHAGDTIQVRFTVKSTVTLSFVSYTAPDSTFIAEHASQQKIFSLATGTFTAGCHDMTITVPCGNFQVDLVCGLAIDKFGPAGSNIFYHAQNRFIDGVNGGPCVTTPTPCGGPVKTPTDCGSGDKGVKDCSNGGKDDKGGSCDDGKSGSDCFKDLVSTVCKTTQTPVSCQNNGSLLQNLLSLCLSKISCKF